MRKYVGDIDLATFFECRCLENFNRYHFTVAPAVLTSHEQDILDLLAEVCSMHRLVFSNNSQTKKYISFGEA